MKKLLLIVGSLNFGFFFSQQFENGYIIDNDGKKTEVLIKNLDWKNNPNKFNYKLHDSQEIKTGTLSTIREFGIINSIKYIRETVKMDQSSNEIKDISNKKEPEFKDETVYLKTLIEGKSNLYKFEKDKLLRFFYNTDNSEIKPLVYKSYYVDIDKISYNEEYKDQLSTFTTCGITENEINRIQYTQTDLISIFDKYNHCSTDETTVNYTSDKKRDWFNLNIRPGINLSKLSVSSEVLDHKNTNFDSKISFRAGIELEFILPFNNGQWSVLLEPAYQYYKASKDVSVSRIYTASITETRTVDYTAVNVGLGVRHYFPLTDQSKLFANVSYALGLSSKTEIIYEQDSDLYSESSGGNFGLGFGYNFNNKFSTEFRINTSQDIISKKANYSSKLQTYSLILGYTLF